MVLVCCIYTIGMRLYGALMSKMKKFFIQFINKMNKELLEEKEPVRQKKLTRSVKTDKADQKKTDKVEPKTDKVEPKKTNKTEPKTDKAEPKTDKTEPKKTNKTEPKTDKAESKEKHKFPLTRAPSKSLVSMYVSKENQELLWESIRSRR
jgi:hypothetical protein